MCFRVIDPEITVQDVATAFAEIDVQPFVVVVLVDQLQNLAALGHPTNEILVADLEQ